MALLPLPAFAPIFEPLKGKRVGFVDSAGSNAGDQYISEATHQLLKAFNIEWTAVDCRLDVPDPVPDVDLLLLAGGGNMSTQHTRETAARQRALTLGLPAILLPQSFRSEEAGTYTHTYVRDHLSLPHCPGGMLAPDLGLGYELPRAYDPPTKPNGIFLRLNGAKFQTQNYRLGWRNLGDPYWLCATPDDLLSLASTYAQIITDRLHFAMAGLLLGRTVTLLPDRFHENRGMWQSWLKDLGCQWRDAPPLRSKIALHAIPDLRTSVLRPVVPKRLTNYHLKHEALAPRQFNDVTLFDALFRRSYTHTDNDLTFYMQVHHDAPLAEAALQRLRRCYPSARVLVVSDGDPDPRYRVMAQQLSLEYHEGENLYSMATHGGKMLHRMFALFMEQPTSFLVKMDTDTRIDRRFRYLPRQADAMFGNKLSPHGPVQGGCMLFPRSVAERLHDSRLLLSPELADPSCEWARTSPFPELHAKHSALLQRVREHSIGEEWVLQWACRQLSITSRCFDEVCSRWNKTYANDDRRFAVVHPDKKMHPAGVVTAS